MKTQVRTRGDAAPTSRRPSAGGTRPEGEIDRMLAHVAEEIARRQSEAAAREREAARARYDLD